MKQQKGLVVLKEPLFGQGPTGIFLQRTDNNLLLRNSERLLDSNLYMILNITFSTGFPFRFKMAEVFLSSSFYLVLLAALALCALFVRLIATTSEPEPKPDTETPPKQGK